MKYLLSNLAVMVFLGVSSPLHAQALPGTKPLEIKGDLAKHMLEGIDKYLSRELAAAPKKRQQYWKPDYSSPEAYDKSVNPNRERLKKILGVVDQRLPVKELEHVATSGQPSLVAETDLYKVYAVRWPVLPGVWGEGLLLEPTGKARACVVAIPDADQTPESLVFPPAKASENPPGQFARELAEYGCRVVVLTLVDRKDTWSENPVIKRATNQPHREFVYRMAYQMGRHVIGYEVQRVLAAVDWFAGDRNHAPIGVYGYGEGGLIALCSGALDTRIHTVATGGYWGPAEDLAEEPIYRNVWGLLREFGKNEMAALVAPRRLILERSDAPAVKGPPAPRPGRGGAAPGRILSAAGYDIGDLKPLQPLWRPFEKQEVSDRLRISISHAGRHGYSAGAVVQALLEDPKAIPGFKPLAEFSKPKDQRLGFDSAPRQKRQFDQLVDYTQKLLPAFSKHRREEFFWSKLDTSSQEKFKKSQEPLRDYFWKEIIGKLPEPDMPLNPRTRLLYETPRWKGYEVVLDVYEDVISYGILLVPNDIKKGEKRPCVVCQHGLEGRPTDVCDPTKKTAYYNSYGAALADQGFVVFAPQNPYIFMNQFRQVVRKGNPLNLTLYSFIVRQHQRILEWLKTLDFVDGARIAYYGLSYGGKVAMRIPSILLDYCLSICSGDFNEWIWKNMTLEWQGSYMFTPEYEMFEFDLGNTFNYAEMAALIAPRPFMVERGHSDGVGLDEHVAFEFAKVRRFYAKLGIADRTEIEFFTGGHEIHLTGTLAFLRKHLDFPAKK